MAEIGVSGFRLEKEFDWERGGAEVGWFEVEERATRGRGQGVLRR